LNTGIPKGNQKTEIEGQTIQWQKKTEFSILCSDVVAHCLSFSPLLLAIALSVVLRITASGYPVGILKPPLKLKIINQTYLVL